MSNAPGELRTTAVRGAEPGAHRWRRTCASQNGRKEEFSWEALLTNWHNSTTSTCSLIQFLNTKRKAQHKWRRAVDVEAFIPLGTAGHLKHAGQTVHKDTEILVSGKWDQLGQDFLMQPRLWETVGMEKSVLQLPPQGLSQDRNDSRGHWGETQRRGQSVHLRLSWS